MLWSDNLSILAEDDIYKQKSTLDPLNVIIKKMPQRGQDIVLMRLEKEYKFGEIARILNVSENNSKVHMNRAMRFIREEFSNHKAFDKDLTSLLFNDLPHYNYFISSQPSNKV